MRSSGPTPAFFGLNTGIAAIGGGGKLFMSPLYALSLAAATTAPSAAAPPFPAIVVASDEGNVAIGLGLIGNDLRERSAPTADPFAVPPRYVATCVPCALVAAPRAPGALPLGRFR